MMKKKLLIIEDDIAMATVFEEYLLPEGYEIQMAHSGEGGLKAIKDFRPDGILLDMFLPDMHGSDILKAVQHDSSGAAIIVITGQASMKTAVEAMQLGAHDFVPKPVAPERLRISVRNVLESVELKQIVKTYEDVSLDSFQDFIGKSPKMQAVYTVLKNAAQSKASVFVTGESGTGKELAARAVHNLSGRQNKPLEVLNCAAIPHNLLESEIFGHVKGAFTGADSDRIGAAARADGGTIFLDELGEMPMDLQAKLLRFIQTGSFMPVGGRSMQTVDVRFVCATNRDPLTAVKEGLLREDLYYRLNVIPVELPPLRERGADIMLLAEHFLARAAQEESKAFKGFAKDAENWFYNYSWPGNVRELENVIRRIVVLNEGGHVERPMVEMVELQEYGETQPIIKAIPAYDGGLFLPQHAEDIRPLKEYEKDIIQAALKACSDNITETSKRLDINPATIHRKMKSWRIN